MTAKVSVSLGRLGARMTRRTGPLEGFMAKQKLRLRDRVYCEFGFGRITGYASRRGSEHRRFNVQLEQGGFGSVCEVSESACIAAPGDKDAITAAAFASQFD